jgi:DNA-binding beta-propeller fold protein YncE
LVEISRPRQWPRKWQWPLCLLVGSVLFSLGAVSLPAGETAVPVLGEASTLIPNPETIKSEFRGIARSQDGAVLVATAEGQLMRLVGKSQPSLIAQLPGDSIEVRSLAIDGNGAVYLLEVRKGILYRLPRGSSSFETIDLSKLSIYGPNGIAIDSRGRILMADTGRNRILRLSPDGKLLDTIGSDGSRPGQFRQPIGIALDKDSAIYVTDAENSRLQKLDPEGKPLLAISTAATPFAVAVDEFDRVYVATHGASKVVVFGRDGQLMTELGSQGSGSPPFADLRGLATSSDGTLLALGPRQVATVQLSPDSSRPIPMSESLRWYLRVAGIAVAMSPLCLLIFVRGGRAATRLKETCVGPATERIWPRWPARSRGVVREHAAADRQWLLPSLACGIIGQLLLSQAGMVEAGAGMLILCLVLAFGLRDRSADVETPTGLGRRAWLCLIATLSLAMVIRLYDNANYPLGIFYDEAYNGLEATTITDTPGMVLWSDALSGRPTFHLYLLALAFRMFGVSAEVLRGVSAMGGTAAILGTFLATRELAGNRVAWLCAFLMTVSRWDMTYSRIAYEAIWGQVFSTFTLWLLIGGLRRRSSWRFALAAIPFAVGFYSYVAYRLFAFPVAAFWMVALARHRATVLRGLAGFVTVGLILVAPMAQFAVTHQAQFLQRFQEVSIFKDVERAGSLKPLADSSLLYAGMLNYRGGSGARHNLPLTSPQEPGAPQLSFFYGALFVLGLGMSLRRSLRPEHALLLGTLLAAAASGALTILQESPHPTRTLLAVPITAIAASMALSRLLPADVSKSWRRMLPLAAVGTILIATAFLELGGFARQMTHPGTYFEFQHIYTAEGRYLRDHYDSTSLYVSEPLLGFPADRIIDLLGYPRKFSALPRFSLADAVPAPDTGRAVSYLLDTVHTQWALPFLQAVYPSGTATTHYNGLRQEEFTVFELPAATVKQSIGLIARYQKGAETRERIEGTPDNAAAPLAAPYSVDWSGILVAKPAGQYRFRLEGASGRLELDGKWVATDRDVRLVAGPHRLQLTAQVPSDVRLKLLWAREGEDLRLVPSTAFYHLPLPDCGLDVSYYTSANGDQKSKFAEEYVPGLMLFPPGRPWERAQWRGEILAPEEGNYRLWFLVDDWGTLAIDGMELASTKGRAPNEVVDLQLRLTAGWHPIDLVLVNQNGSHGIGLEWQPPNGGKQRVLGRSFRPARPY